MAGLQTVLQHNGLAVRDSGNVSGPGNPWQPPVAGYRHLAEVVAWNQAVFEAVSAALCDGDLPMLLGGDHSLAIGSIGAVAAAFHHSLASSRAVTVASSPPRLPLLSANSPQNSARAAPSIRKSKPSAKPACGSVSSSSSASPSSRSSPRRRISRSPKNKKGGRAHPRLPCQHSNPGSDRDFFRPHPPIFASLRVFRGHPPRDSQAQLSYQFPHHAFLLGPHRFAPSPRAHRPRHRPRRRHARRHRRRRHRPRRAP